MMYRDLFLVCFPIEWDINQRLRYMAKLTANNNLHYWNLMGNKGCYVLEHAYAGMTIYV